MDMVLEIVAVIVAFLVVLTVHEAAHALVAFYLGDPTAKIEGRVTLNPVKHLDPLGTIVLLVTQRIGWGKPVPVNPRNFKHPVRGAALTALAGPASNFILALVLAIPLKYVGGVLPAFVAGMMTLTLNLSIYLGVFNFLPIPPLDGSKVLGLVVPKRWHYQYERYLQEGMRYLVIILLIDWFLFSRLFGFSVVGYVVTQMYLVVYFLIFWGI